MLCWCWLVSCLWLLWGRCCVLHSSCLEKEKCSAFFCREQVSQPCLGGSILLYLLHSLNPPSRNGWSISGMFCRCWYLPSIVALAGDLEHFFAGVDPVASAEPLLPRGKTFEPCWVPALMSLPSNHKCWMNLGVPQCIKCYLSLCSLQRSRFMWPVEQICYLWEKVAAGPN